jgi:anti-sigma factor RsiW
MMTILQNQPRCEEVRASFSDYLDGAVTGQTMQTIAGHLEECAACTHEFAGWRAVQESLAALRRPKPPEHLALKLRLAISREQSRRSSRLLDTLSLRWTNTMRPMLVQVSAGFAMAVVLLGTVGFLLGTVAAPEAVLANDEPLGAITPPHYRYSVDRQRPIVMDHDATIVVEAQVNDQGRVFDYAIVSGPLDSAAHRQIGDQLLLSVFEPARVFGTPVRGRVVLTYAGVSVHG